MKAEELRKSILQQAIQGKLVAQDPTDEPASVLLERIREEKKHLIKDKKIKKDKNESIIFKGEDNSHYEKILATGEVKCIDNEIPFEIPESWAWCRLGSICSINPKNFDVDDELEVSFIAMKDIMQGYSSKYSYENKYWGNIKKGFTHFAKGDIGIAKITPCFQNRKSSIFTELKNDIGAGTTELHILRAHISDVANYILTVCKTEYFISYGVRKFTGTAGQQRVPTQAIIDLLIPFPPLAEQKRIFSRLDELEPLLVKYDKFEKENTILDLSLPNCLNKSILQYAIQGKLVEQDTTDEPASVLLDLIREEKRHLIKNKIIKADKNESYIYKNSDNSYYEKIGNITSCIDDELPFTIPDNWVWCRLSSLCWLGDGDKIKDERLPYLEAKYLRGRDIAKIMENGKVVDAGIKVILVDGENSGEVFDIKERGYLGSTFKVLNINTKASMEYVLTILYFYKTLFKESKIGAAIPHLNKALFRELLVGLPPLNEQIRIVEKLNQIREKL